MPSQTASEFAKQNPKANHETDRIEERMQIRRAAGLLAWMGGNSASSPRDSNAPSRLPARIFWVAFVVRVLFLTIAHKYRLRTYLDHFEFGWEMGRISRALATGFGYADPFNGHSGPTAWAPPLYPLLLAGVFKLFGVYTLKSAWVILTLNSLFSAAIAPAVYEIAWRCFGRNARGMSIALWSGWLWALYPAAMQYAVHWVWEMSLSTALFSWILVVALRVRGLGDDASMKNRPQPLRLWILFGSLWGLLALSNSSLISFLPFCGLWMIWPEFLRQRAALAMRNAVLAAVCCAAIVSPWIIRNWYAFHAFVPLRANFGAELYESTLPSNNGFPWGGTLSLAERDPGFMRYKQLGEVEFSKEQGAKAMLFVHQHRRIFVKLAIKRFYFFWMSVPHPFDKSATLEFLREFSYGFISLGGIFGLALAFRHHVPGAWLFFWAFLMLPALYYFVTVQARFRHPLEPIMTVLIVYLFQSARRSPARRVRTATESIQLDEVQAS